MIIILIGIAIVLVILWFVGLCYYANRLAKKITVNFNKADPILAYIKKVIIKKNMILVITPFEKMKDKDRDQLAEELSNLKLGIPVIIMGHHSRVMFTNVRTAMNMLLDLLEKKNKD